MSKPTEFKFAFFGSRPLAIPVLEELEKKGFVPTLIITETDRPVGRKKVLTPPKTKIWAETRNIEVCQPETLKNGEFYNSLLNSDWDLFVVASFGMILPKKIVEKPKHKTLNVHPSLLPKLRGPSPVRSAILRDEAGSVGVTIIELDKQMDHGPILAQETIEFNEWPPAGDWLEQQLAYAGGRLLADILPNWLEGKITPKAQDDTQASICKKLKKEDGLINLADTPYQNWLKIQALKGWPGVYFFHNQTRVIIKEARFQNGTLLIKRVVPEGKKEMSFEQFQRGYHFNQ